MKREQASSVCCGCLSSTRDKSAVARCTRSDEWWLRSVGLGREIGGAASTASFQIESKTSVASVLGLVWPVLQARRHRLCAASHDARHDQYALCHDVLYTMSYAIPYTMIDGRCKR